MVWLFFSKRRGIAKRKKTDFKKQFSLMSEVNGSDNSLMRKYIVASMYDSNRAKKEG